jgi:carbamoyltransferase
MEFGPRALGARSILGDPRDPAMQRTMNLKIKQRESFRPFAPTVLAEQAGAWFDLDGPSPYMLVTAPVTSSRRVAPPDVALHGLARLDAPRSVIPAVTHVDHSARVQTLTRGDNPRYYDLIARFGARTGCPLLINTSFNVRGEPIVCTPGDAYACFMRTGIDHLVVGDHLLAKSAQPPWRGETPAFALD